MATVTASIRAWSTRVLLASGKDNFTSAWLLGEVSTVALLFGDPFRVPLISEFLTDVREIAHNREHRTMTGMYKGKKITATSTGMGCPSTAIAVEELARVGVRSFIRAGRKFRRPSAAGEAWRLAHQRRLAAKRWYDRRLCAPGISRCARLAHHH